MGNSQSDRYRRYRGAVRPHYKGPGDGPIGTIPSWKQKQDTHKQTINLITDSFGRGRKAKPPKKGSRTFW